jgi:hypothetical protein
MPRGLIRELGAQPESSRPCALLIVALGKQTQEGNQQSTDEHRPRREIKD